MDASDLESLARAVATGELSPSELVERVRVGAVADLGYAQVDTERGVRTGVSEVIYGAGKSAAQIAGIVDAMRGAGQERILITRMDERKAAELAEMGCSFAYHAEAHAGVVGELPEPDGNGEILVLTAGTSDIAVAEEAVLTARFLGNSVTCV